MFLIDNPFTLPVPPAAPAIGTPGWFTKGNSGLNQPATPVDDWWLNMIQAELQAVLDAAGIALDKANNAQLVAAINVLIAAAIAANAPNLSGVALLAADNSWAAPQLGAGGDLTSGVAWDGTRYQELAGNVNGGIFTIANPSAALVKHRYAVTVTYTTAHSIVFGGMFKGVSDITPTAEVGATDEFFFRCTGTEMRCFGYRLNTGG